MGKKRASEQRRVKSTQSPTPGNWFWLALGLGALGFITLLSLLPFDSGVLREIWAPFLVGLLGWAAPLSAIIFLGAA
ncbi:MAG: hypothetical protein HYX86_05455, partial [Chloroflexi bacterium]|nr:hypothetical protein [Chloroflexota bacterium]